MTEWRKRICVCVLCRHKWRELVPHENDYVPPLTCPNCHVMDGHPTPIFKSYDATQDPDVLEELGIVV
jgi:hypothetical protein